MTSLRVCVVGVGAIGGAVAAALARGGAAVSVLARAARCAQLRTDGLCVEPAAPLHLAVSEHADFGVQDVVCVAVKSHALPALLPTLTPLIGPETLIVPLVNGIPFWYFAATSGRFAGDCVVSVDPAGTLHDAFPAERIVGSVVFVTARLGESGIVTLYGAPRLILGGISTTAARTDPSPPSTRLAALTTALNAGGIATSLSADIRADLWTKVALNLATNPLSVVTEATLVEQFTSPELLPIVTAILEETQRVAAGYGIAPTLSLDAMLATGRRAGAFQTSMLQDYLAGRPLELAAIGNAVLELAAKIGQDMPIARHLIALCTHRSRRTLAC